MNRQVGHTDLIMKFYAASQEVWGTQATYLTYFRQTRSSKFRSDLSLIHCGLSKELRVK